jgi:hypothetical protein
MKPKMKPSPRNIVEELGKTAIKLMASTLSRFRPCLQLNHLYLQGFAAIRESEFHRNLHRFGCPFRNWLLPGNRLPTARQREKCRWLHTHKHE